MIMEIDADKFFEGIDISKLENPIRFDAKSVKIVGRTGEEIKNDLQSAAIHDPRILDEFIFPDEMEDE